MHQEKNARRRLLDAALDLFSRQEYSTVTTQAIAKKARVNQVTLFRIFGSKKALLRAVVGMEKAARNADNELYIDPTDDLEADLVRIGERMSRHMISREKFMRLVASASRRHPDLWTRASRPPSEVLVLLARFFRMAERKGLVARGVAPEKLAEAFFFYWLGATVSDAFLDDGGLAGLDRERVRRFVGIFIHGISPGIRHRRIPAGIGGRHMKTGMEG